MSKLKIDTPMMFSSFKTAYRVYDGETFTEFLTLSSAKFHKDLELGRVLTEVCYIKNKLIREIECE